MGSPSFPILFVAPERLDDAILASGLVKRLFDEVPHARFTVAAGPDVATLFRDVPGLERVIGFEPQRFGLHWWKLWGQVRGRRWGLVLDMRGSRLARFLHARRRAVRRPLNPALDPVHKVLEAARVLRIDDDPPAPYLFTGPETEAKADKLVGPGGQVLAIAPAADWTGKTWPAERFAMAGAELLGATGPLPNGRLMILGRAEDRWATETVRRVTARNRMIDLVGRVDLLTAYACLKRARLFIGNEGPFMHLAAAAGTPTLGLLGPTDERLYGPWGPAARTLRGPRTFDQLRALDPSFSLAVCHMQDLTSTKAVAAARDLIAATAPRADPEPEPALTSNEGDHG
ncbi:MAG TPA: glycosyltransferase family 9 protein [Caulobacteraceae bacterium]|jgi:ADP-heptose:LPS heptosyltransferase|nr:glycosyltransferase family 9 protein [Caulobacteraceae bacterium]